MENKLISVITVSYNAYATLETTIKSVLSQKSDLIEYWIVDGGSSDGSVEIIKKYEGDITGWLTEPDNGIYDAMNKGISLSKGKWIYFLGADDTLNTQVIDEISQSLVDKYSVVFGNVLFDNNHLMESFLGKRTLLQNTVHHQSAFYNRKLFDSFRYDTNLKILADYELNLKVYIENKLTKYIPIVVAKCATGGASSHLDLSLRETNAVRSKYIGKYWLRKILSASLHVYYFQKKVRFKLYGHKI